MQNPLNLVDPSGISSEKVVDPPNKNLNRVFGALKLIGGIAEAAAGTAAGVATSWTGVGAVVGGAVAVHGADVAVSGFMQLVSGEDTSSLTSKAIQATGVSKDTSDVIDNTISIVGSGAATGIVANAKAASTVRVNTVADGASKVKKTSGRLGNESTRSQINDISTKLEAKGWFIEGGGQRAPEEFLKPLGAGRKGGSYPDITATHPDYPTLRINTVDVNRAGLPTIREAINATRIRTQIPLGEHLLLIPKR